MSIKVDRNILLEILSDETFKKELDEYLNDIIDKEIEKADNMDTELVDDSISILSALENDDYENAISNISSNDKIVRFCHRKTSSNAKKARQFAAVITLVLISAGVTIQSYPALANDIIDFFSKVTYSLGLSADESAEGNIECSYIRFDAPDYITDHINSIDDIDLSDFKFYAVDFDGNETEIPLSKCKVNNQITKDNENNDCVIVTVSYAGASTLITFYFN